LPDHYYAQPAPRFDPITRIEHAEKFVSATGADIRHGGGRAYYTIAGDYIQMPPFESFRDAGSYYATVLHELVHFTKGPGRLDRDFGRKRFGDEGYATEELVAELGAAFLCGALSAALLSETGDFSWPFATCVETITTRRSRSRNLERL
jgi:antirestriction protein ArdC